MPVIVGTSGPDTLTGTNAAECLVGLAGDDVLVANGGADVLIGGPGDDTLYGGNQADTLFGDEGEDTLEGGNQDDVLWGGADDDELRGDNGKDELHGDDGDDFLEGGTGKDELHGGAGCDVLDGRNGSDRLHGDDGNDVIHGGRAPEVIEGGSGDDAIEGGSAPDVLIGGPGFDRCIGADCEAPPPAECGTGCATGICETRADLCVPSGFCPAGIDAGVPDAGGMDAFTLDAFEIDSPAPPDAYETPDAVEPSDAFETPDAYCGATTDPTCDGTDEDCDGSIDEDYASTPTTCGTGACGATGATSCVAGTIADSCTPGAPAADDATCDGIDDDCDGTEDEDYASTPTTCGIGACGATGATSCVAGTITDSCTPGVPAANDATCDAIDDDCDGLQDEDHPSVPTSCGLGACAATGLSACVAGAVVDSCAPGAPLPDDATCDAIDDDCNGIADEDYVSVPTTCGLGVCASTGSTFCFGGAVGDSCVAGPAWGADDTCNLTDDDCDGAIDESYVASCDGTDALTCTPEGEVRTSCDDGDVCTGAESCDAGACQPGVPLDVDDANPCTADACDPIDGVSHDPLADGTSCSDGDLCNGAETCQAGACVAGPVPGLDDGNPCTADACAPMTGVSHTPLPVGASCDDGDPCDGIETCTALAVCVPGLRPLDGPCVPAAPAAVIFLDQERELLCDEDGASVISYTGSREPFYFADVLSWDSDVEPGGAQVIVDLGGDVSVVDRVRMTGNGVRHFEIAVSTTGTAPGDFTTIFSGEASATFEAEEYDTVDASARYLRITLLDTWSGELGWGSFRDFTALTRPRDGGALNVYESGRAPVTATPAIGDAHYATDWDASTEYVASPWAPGHTLEVDLPGVTRHVIDRVRLRARDDWSSLRGFELWVSGTGTSPADFTMVLSGELTADDASHFFFFPPVAARYVQLRATSNQGGGPSLALTDLQTFTMVRGGMTAPFENRSLAGGYPIVWSRWDFGDGDVSLETHPTHEYAAPGSYLVRLEVIDEYGLWSQTELLYTAEAPPLADVEVSPAHIAEGDTISFTDASSPSSSAQPLVASRWEIEGPGFVVAPFSRPPGDGTTYDPFDSRPVTVRVTAIDSSLLEDVIERVVPVANVPPQIGIADDQTLYWGERWVPREAGAVVLTDASSVEANTLLCDYDFDDGTVVTDLGCQQSDAASYYVEHRWEVPGTYDVVFAATDADGDRTEQHVSIEVVRRPTSIVLDSVEDFASGGLHEVTAHLIDEVDGSVVEGRSVEVSFEAAIATGATDASGRALVTLDLGTGAPGVIAAHFAGDALYEPTFGSRAQPEAPTGEAHGSCGRDFLLTTLRRCGAADSSCFGEFGTVFRDEIVLSADVETVAQLTVQALGFSRAVHVPAHGTVVAEIPRALEHHEPGTVDSLVLEVTAGADVCATVLSYEPFITDSFLALPTAQLGSEYVVHHYGQAGGVGDWSQIIVVGTAAATTVTVTPPTGIEMLVPGSAPGAPHTFTLDRGQAFMLQNALAGEDLSGAHVVADAPIAVIAGHNCVSIPPGVVACDTVVEQTPPGRVLGTSYVVPPLAGRASGYIAEVGALTDGTDVFVDGSLVATISPTEIYTIDETTQSAHVVTSSAPVLVTQYARGGGSDGVGDPFQMTIVPSDRFGRSFGFTTVPDYEDPVLRQRIEFFHHATLVTTLADTGAVRLDGLPVTGWVPVGGTDLAYALLDTDAGDHRVDTLAPAATVGAYAYGWETFESYGHPGYYRLTPRASCVSQPTVPGNGEDDDCDGRLDEELANGVDDDGDGLIDEDLQRDGVAAVNLAPVAQAGRIGTREDTPKSFVLSGFDANGDVLTFEVLSLPTHGVLTGTAPSLTYEPNTDFHGEDTLTFRACDPFVCSEPATFTLAVASEGDPPDIDMVPFLDATTNGLLTLPCVASHIDELSDCAITWTLVDGPPGMTIDQVTADIYWLPGPDYMNTAVSVTVRVTDCRGLSSVFTFGVGVGAVTTRPIITSRPVTDARVGTLYQYDVEAIELDPGEFVAGFHLDPLFTPPGLSIDEPSGLLSWTPSALDAGEHEVHVWAEDSVGTLSLPQVFTITVGGDTTAPSVTVVADPDRILDGESSSIEITVTDDLPGAVIASATIFGPGYPPTGAPLALTPALPTDAATATFTASATGVYPIVAVGLDTSGNRTTRTTAIRVLVPGDDAPPAVELTAPAADAELTYLHDAIGSVFDDNLYHWSLDIRRHDRQARAEGYAGEEPHRTLAEGRENVSGTLADIDTTQLENGLYVLRLRGEDVNGQVGEDTVVVRVEGGAKVGVVQLSFVDLVTEDFGIPIAIVRSYDSRRAYRVGDFGHGWELELRMGSVQSNIPTGEAYAISTQPDDFTPCTRVQEQAHHFTEVQLSADEWYVFHPEPVNIQTVSGGCAGEIAFEQTDGSRPGATLTPVGSTSFRATSLPVSRFGAWAYESNFVSNETGEPLRIESFVLTTRDGRTFWLNTRDGVTDMQDRNGNTVSIRQGVISHSSGRGMRLVRDARGRITQVLGGDGRSVGYGYDGTGNLVSFLDPAARTTRFEYRSAAHPHHLTDIIDWRGVRVAAIDYQPDGRLGRMCDADGVCQRSSYDLANSEMTITDGLGIPNRYAWDQRGNVTHVYDGLGGLTQYAYGLDCPDDVVGITDQLGHTTSTFRDPVTCDVIRRVEPHLPTEDAEDFTTSYQYDEAGRRTRTILPSGGELRQEYDERGNETAWRDGVGALMWQATFDSVGREISSVDPFGTTISEFDGDSVEPTRVTDAEGRVTEVVYDATGQARFVDHGEGETTRLAYDAYGRETYTVLDDGNAVELAYGEGNEWTRMRDEDGVGVDRTFSASGRVTRMETTDGASQSFRYDALGRVRESTDATGRTTTSHYDAAGRLEESHDEVTGATTTMEHDAVGRTTAVTDALGHRTEMEYHPSGYVTSMTDASGEVWDFDRTPSTRATTDPLGRTTTEERTDLGLPAAIDYADGSRITATYRLSTEMEDAREYPSRIVDELGRERVFTYGPQLRLESATDLGGRVWTFTGFDTDEETVTSPEGRTIRFVRDPENGQTTEIHHEDGQTTFIDYTADSDPFRIRRPGGLEVTFTYDAEGREERREASTGEWREELFDTEGRQSGYLDPGGTTSFGFDVAGRFETSTFPTGARLRYGHDLLDRVSAVHVRPSALAPEASTVYERDEVGRIERVTDPLGGVTTWTYDAAGQPLTRTFPNGVRTEWTWDLRGRVSSIRHRRVSDSVVLMSRAYVRNLAGEPTRITHEDGRYVEVSYNTRRRVSEERWYTSGGSLVEAILYTYDDDGNRTTRTSAAGVEQYHYGVGWRLSSIERASVTEQAFAYDSAGRVTGITRDGRTLSLTHNALDQLVSATDGASTTSWTFDGHDMRVGVTDALGTRRVIAGPEMGEGLDVPHAVTSTAGAVHAAYVYAEGRPLMRYAGASALYYLEDGLGSIIGLADGTATATARMEYDAFGNIRSSMGPDVALDPTTDGDFRFRGLWQDRSTGLYYARARMYDARTGRFLSRDAVEGDRTEVESYLGYDYAYGNPFVYSDPTGTTTLNEVNISAEIDRILQTLPQNAGRWAIQQAREEAQAAVSDAVSSAVMAGVSSFLGGVGPFAALADAAAQGRYFEQMIEDGICGFLFPGREGSAATPNANDYRTWPRLAMPLAQSDGMPRGDGLGCRTRLEGFGRFRAGTRGTSYPDIVLSGYTAENIQRRRSKTYLLVDFKLTMPPRADAGDRRQMTTFGRHAGQWEYARTVMTISLTDRGRPGTWWVTRLLAGMGVFHRNFSVT